MKKVLSFFCILFFLAALFLELNTKSVQEIVNDNYATEIGLIKSYGRNNEVSVLSESMGQYMEYLLFMKDDRAFYEQTELLRDYFLAKQNDSLFIKWQVEDNTSTNASVDDLRIIHSLKKAGRIFQRAEYSALAGELEKSLLAHQLKDGVLTDFYDWKTKQKSPLIHLSYIDMDVLENTIGIDKTAYQEMLERSGLEKSPFFQEVWNIEKKKYEQANKQEVDIIDQLLIAIQYVKGLGKTPDTFDKWLKNKWQIQGELFGRYVKTGHTPSVPYESSAVYALAVQYFLLTGQDKFADELNKKLLKQPPFMVQNSLSSIHFFDFMLAHITAEQYEQERQKNKNSNKIIFVQCIPTKGVRREF